MGGKLKDDGSMYGGYDDIYGSRSYKTGGKKGEGLEIFDLDEEYLFKYSVIIWSTLAFSNIRISMWLSSFFMYIILFKYFICIISIFIKI